MSQTTKEQKYGRVRLLSMGIKYLVSAVFAFLPFIATGAYGYTITALIELFLLAILTDIILQKKRMAAYIFNAVMLAMFDLQMGVLFFGSTYISTVMISNLGSAEDLAGNAVTYISAIILVIVIAILPISSLGGSHSKGISISRRISVLLVTAGMEFLSVAAMGTRYSPYGNYLILLQQEYENYQMSRSLTESVEKYAAESNGMNTDGESDGTGFLFYTEGFYSERSQITEKRMLLCQNSRISF